MRPPIKKIWFARLTFKQWQQFENLFIWNSLRLVTFSTCKDIKTSKTLSRDFTKSLEGHLMCMELTSWSLAVLNESMTGSVCSGCWRSWTNGVFSGWAGLVTWKLALALEFRNFGNCFGSVGRGALLSRVIFLLVSLVGIAISGTDFSGSFQSKCLMELIVSPEDHWSLSEED